MTRRVSGLRLVRMDIDGSLYVKTIVIAVVSLTQCYSSVLWLSSSARDYRTNLANRSRTAFADRGFLAQTISDPSAIDDTSAVYVKAHHSEKGTTLVQALLPHR